MYKETTIRINIGKGSRLVVLTEIYHQCIEKELIGYEILNHIDWFTHAIEELASRFDIDKDEFTCWCPYIHDGYISNYSVEEHWIDVTVMLEDDEED